MEKIMSNEEIELLSNKITEQVVEELSVRVTEKVYQKLIDRLQDSQINELADNIVTNLINSSSSPSEKEDKSEIDKNEVEDDVIELSGKKNVTNRSRGLLAQRFYEENGGADD